MLQPELAQPTEQRSPFVPPGNPLGVAPTLDGLCVTDCAAGQIETAL